MNQNQPDKAWHEQHPFILPDGRGISCELVERLCDAIGDDSLMDHYFDLQSFEIDAAHSQIRDCVIPHADSKKMRELMEENLELMKDPILEEDWERDWAAPCQKLESLLADPSLSALDIEREMYKVYPCHMGGWDQAKHDYLWEVLEEWLCTEPILAKDNPRYWFGDDDCPMCKYMLAVEEGWISPTQEGTMGAMHQANLKQQIDEIMKEK